MPVSSLNSDYGKTWGVLSKTSQVNGEKTTDSDFKLVLAKSVAEKDESLNNSADSVSSSTDVKENSAGVSDADADTAYRHSLLDPNKLPEGLKWGNGSFSMDVVAKPEFRVTEAGNIERVDTLTGGRRYFSLIPNTEGGWKVSQDGDTDSAVGNVFSRQDSAYKASIAFARGCGSGDYSPNGYVEGRFEESLEEMLKRTETAFTHVWA